MAGKRAAPRILIVESDLADGILLRELIAVSNIGETAVHQVATLADATTALDRGPWELVLLSLRLPDASGLPALAQLLRGRAAPPAVVVVTSRENRPEAFRAQRAGAMDVLVKGEFEPRVFPRLVRSAIERHHLHRALDRSRLHEQFLATHHPLTQLPQRAAFQERLTEALAGGGRSDALVAVLSIDLDQFERINTALGHAAGDIALQEMARRLRALVHPNDAVSHLSGDEFAVALLSVARKLDAARFAHRVCEALREPLLVAEREVSVSASIGIALHPEDGSDANALLSNAGVALRAAKNGGRDTHRFYTPAMNGRFLARLTLENDLRRAIDRDELTLLYQPMLDGASGRLLGVEALLRWRRGSRAIPALEFMPLAEASGMTRTLDEWALRKACEQLVRWEIDGLVPVSLAVNVSPSRFFDTEFATAVENVLQEVRVDPGRLVLELNEGGIGPGIETCFTSLAKLRELGVGLALDNFGTGSAPLTALQDLPLNGLKIAPRVIRGCRSDAQRSAHIGETIIALGRGLGLDVTAVGVEEPEQRSFLLERGCMSMQGCLFAPPLEADEVSALLRLGRVPFDRK